MPNRDEKLFLDDIFESIKAIEKYTNGINLEQFSNDRKTYSATIREFQIIGEAIRNLSRETTERYPEIEWRDIRDFRNILVHEYFGIDFDIIWKIITDDLPLLKKVISKMLDGYL